MEKPNILDNSLCLFVTLLLLFSPYVALSQATITGTVKSVDDGEPLIGATIQIKGTSQGTIADVNGNYTISASSDDVLVFSFVGFESQEIRVGSQSVINVNLGFDMVAMEEVVVVGYGTQREKDLTSAITTIKTEEIIKTPTSQAMQALQGKVPGVQIVSSGAPGSSPTVRVRGVGSLEGSAAPLYVVDGMFFDNIDFLNTADIQSISVLKDASAAAIYGVRAANGVILIETKSGSYNQAPEISYSGYYGVQVAQNVLEMANTEQFVAYALATGSAADAAFIDNSFQRFGRSRSNPDLPAADTDWYDEVLESSSPIQSHSVSINGGNEQTRYSVGTSYFSQEGLLVDTRNKYERLNFRTKIDFSANEWLTVGGNVNLSNATQYNAEQSTWFRTYFAVPILPVFDENNTDATPVKLANSQLLGYRGTQNPYITMLYQDNRNNIGKILGNFYADLELIPNRLSFKTSYNYSYGTINTREVDFAYNDGVTEVQSAIRKGAETSFNEIWDNVLTYNQSFDRHNVTVLAGYSRRSETNEGLFARGTQLDPVPDRAHEELWYLEFADVIDVGSVNDNEPKYGKKEYGVSYFGRIAYNFDDRYLLYGTLRNDGTNKFQKKSGYFPTFGAGWVLSEESFFNLGFVDFLKIRGSWGKLGNDGIDASVGAATLAPTTTAINDLLVPGTTVDNVFDFLDRWETTVETNIGLTGTLLNGRLSVEADYFNRDTENAAVTVIVPLIRANVRLNEGEIRNSGFEMMVNWSDRINENLSYSVGGNIATLNNEVRDLGGPRYLDAGQAEFRQRSILGSPHRAFFGYEVLGIFQNASDIANSGLDDTFIADNNLEPGDFIYKDQNNDGFIDDLDRVVIGSYLPDLMYGFNLAVTYKNWDLSAFFQGQSGHSILNRKRGEIIFTTDTNIDAELASNLWNGEGSSNKYPSAAGLRKGYNQAMSEYYVEDGSYFRIQNVKLSYTLQNNQLFNTRMPDASIIFTAERPLTLFDYNGFNPEVPDGIDRQTYPIPAVYTIGLNLKL